MIRPCNKLFVQMAICSCLLISVVSQAQEQDAETKPPHVATASGQFGGSTITIGISKKFAGAIDSLTWKGREFVNSHDHGRELQSAASFDGYGECYNPTEAGSGPDKAGEHSSSVLLAFRQGANWIETTSKMAFWLQPGQVSHACPKGVGAYSSTLSDVGFSKRVTIGAHGVANAIEYQANFILQKPYSSALFEPLTGYMPPEFSKFWTFDPISDQLTPLSDGPSEQPLPIIFSTPDGSYAMGVWSANLPQPKFPKLGYGRWRFANIQGPAGATVKWNCVFREQDVAAGPHSYVCYAVVGSLKDVQAGIKSLSSMPAPIH